MTQTSPDPSLQNCNESELLWLARLQGLPPLRRGLPREELESIVAGVMPVEERHIAGTNYTRSRLEAFIQKKFELVRGQLPGCDGRCMSYPCTEAKHMSCFVPNEATILSHD